MEVQAVVATSAPIEIDILDLIGYEFKRNEYLALVNNVKRLAQVKNANVLRHVLFVTIDMGDLPDHLIDRAAQTLYTRIVRLVTNMCSPLQTVEEHLELVYTRST